MALLDQVQRMEQQVARRLRELEPLVAEYRELQKVAERLGLSHADGKATAPRGRRVRAAAGTPSAAAPATTSRAASSRSSRRRTARGRRQAAAPGSRQQEVLRLVGERPGISVRELGKQLGVDPTGLYQIVRRLVGRGLIRKEGKQLQPVARAAASSEDSAGAAP